MGSKTTETPTRGSGGGRRGRSVRRFPGRVALGGLAALFGLTLAAWGRSYLIRDVFWRPHSEGGAVIQSFRGKLHWVSSASVDPTRGRGNYHEPLLADSTWDIGMPEYPDRPQWLFGFSAGQYWVQPRGSGSWRTYWFVAVPYWALAVASGVGPAVWAVRRSMGIGVYGRGRCRRCGYDVRASDHRCPECGGDLVRGAWQGFWGRF